MSPAAARLPSSTPTSAPARPWRRRAALASRVVAALAGGWVFAEGFVMLALALGRRAGLSYADAQTLARLLVFPVYVAAICGSFSAARGARVWGVLVGGGVLMTAAGAWLMGVRA